MILEYKNECLTDYNLEENASAMKEALKLVDSQKGEYYPLIIGGEKITTVNSIVSINPSNTNEVIGRVASADINHAEQAVIAALEAFTTWKEVSSEERARYIFKAAAIIRRRKYEFSALLCEEAGKNWVEADGDTAEAIDFLEYYARQILKFCKQN